eukprot:jgi/Ulvmu1/5358/UM022_0152.1
MRPVNLHAPAPVARPLRAHDTRLHSYTRVNCTASYNERLTSAADASDAVTALEVLTEARITKSDLSPEAAEAGVRAVASVSVVKACEVLHTHLLSKGIQPCFNTTLPLLFRELKISENSSAFEELVAAVEPGLMQSSGILGGSAEEAGDQSGSLKDQQDAMRCLNMMLRQFAKLDVDGAVDRVRSYHKRGVIIEGATYSQLAAASLTAGDFPQAELMLEMRDYL